MSNFSLSSEGPSRGGVFLVYGLYIARFFTGISLLAGVILAYILKGSSAGLVRSHLSWLIRLFWYDVAFIIGCAVLFGACFITEPPGSSGPGQLLFLIPIGIFLLWNIALLVSLLYGVRSLTQGKGPLPDRFRALGE